MQEVYEGLENDPKANNFAGHCGRESTYQNLDKRHGSGPIEVYQKLPILSTTRKIFYNDQPRLTKIPRLSEVMKQIGVGLCNPPEVDGFNYSIVHNDFQSGRK